MSRANFRLALMTIQMEYVERPDLQLTLTQVADGWRLPIENLPRRGWRVGRNRISRGGRRWGVRSPRHGACAGGVHRPPDVGRGSSRRTNPVSVLAATVATALEPARSETTDSSWRVHRPEPGVD